MCRVSTSLKGKISVSVFYRENQKLPCNRQQQKEVGVVTWASNPRTWDLELENS